MNASFFMDAESYPALERFQTPALAHASYLAESKRYVLEATRAVAASKALNKKAQQGLDVARENLRQATALCRQLGVAQKNGSQSEDLTG